MKKHLSKKRVVLAAIVTVALALASGVAYAYWTSTGSGTGAAAAATSLPGITVNQTSTVTAMHPGDSPQSLSGNFINNAANAGPVYVSTVTASIASVTLSDGTTGTPSTCSADDFTLSNPVATVNKEVPVGNPELTVTWSGPTIQFNDKTNIDQNACKGATVNLGYSIP